MHTASLNVAIHSALDSARVVGKLTSKSTMRLPRFLRAALNWFALPRLRTTAERLAYVCNSLKISLLDVQQDTSEALIDEDMKQRDLLESMKAIMRDYGPGIGVTLAEIDPDGSQMPELRRIDTSVQELIAELYDLANQLQWAIAEHDATYSRRVEGFTASSKAELEAMLARIG